MDRGKVVFCGDGSNKCKEVLNHTNSIFKSEIEASSKYIAVLAMVKYKQKRFEDVAYFEPFYFKDFVAGKPKKLL